jgi:hypothetical protein
VWGRSEIEHALTIQVDQFRDLDSAGAARTPISLPNPATIETCSPGAPPAPSASSLVRSQTRRRTDERAANLVALDALDQKAAAAFPGLVVRKDLLRRLRSAYSVPIFVIEFLHGKYCASTDPTVIEQGMAFVNVDEAIVRERDLADVSGEVLNKLQPVFYTDPINAAIRAIGLE